MQGGGQSRFPTTRWTLVVSAGDSHHVDADQAFSSLCELYWQPVYAFIRRCGYSADAAQDLTQGFFTSLLEKHYVGRASPDKGRFRSFLLGSLKHYLHDERDRDTAKKRGGGQHPLQLDFVEGEELYRREPVDREDPERIFERQWISGLVLRVLAKLEKESAESGKRERFDQLKPFLVESREAPYDELASRLNMNSTALKVAIHRLRKRYRELFRFEIADTVATPGEVDDEIRHLLQVLEA